MKKNFKLFLLTILGTWMTGNVMAENGLYLVGGATACGWEASEYHRSPVSMMQKNDSIWIWFGKLTTGDNDNGAFKIPNQSGNWDGYWAPSEWCPLQDGVEVAISTDGAGDYKFSPVEEGLYKVTLNTNAMTIRADKLTNAPSQDGDYYQISSVEDFYWFAAFIATDGTKASKARLTADLDFTTDGFFPLASDKFKFKGEFDGAGHTVKFNIIGNYNNVGFFRWASDGANIHDLILEGSVEGNAKVGGVIGHIHDGGEVKLTNVINKASVTSIGNQDANAAAFVGCAEGGTKITALNCANLGAVTGQAGQCAAFTGWPQGGTTFTNCWNCGTISGMEGNLNLYRGSGNVVATNCYDATGNESYTQGEKVAATTIASGELCYLLNGKQSTDVSWYQAIGTDAYPTPFGTAVVYAVGSFLCDGVTPKEGAEATYSNTQGENNVDDHQFNDWGFCSVCDAIQTDFMTPAADGYYEIGSKQQLNWFACRVNGHKSTVGIRNINARLTADIDFSAQQVMIGNGDNDEAYRGTFDGQGHKVTLGYTVNEKNVALFRYLSNATIKNLITDGTIKNESNSCSGGIFAGSRGVTVVENCVSYVSFVRESAGDATIGGIGAYMHDNGTLRNVAFYGSVNASNSEGNGGLLGYANGGENVAIVNAVVNASMFSVASNSTSIARNTNNAKNVFVVNCGTLSHAQQINANEEQMSSGELCFWLNNNVSGGTDWYQLIGTDLAPLPIAKEGAVVYVQNDLTCDGEPKGAPMFSNTESQVKQDEHQFNEWGFCKNCNALKPDFLTPDANNCFALGTDKELNWFAHYATKIDATANAILTSDIDMVEVIGFPGIGNPENKYTGTFDGQGHKISNLSIDNQATEQPTGFFNEVTAGAVIKNFTIDNTCFITGHHYVAAFVGHVDGNGTVLLQQLGNEADVMAWYQNAGGILGCNTSGELKLTLENCYNIGIISGTNECGGLSGWLGNDANTINCYNMGTVNGDGSESFARGNNIQVTNCFDPVTDWATLPKTPIEDFTNGTVYKALSEAAPGVWFLSAAENGYPVLYNTGITTGIDNVNMNLSDNDRIYNLNGQQVQKAQKGLYIVNGKKLFVR